MPAGTPDAILDRLNAEITKIIAQPEVQKRLVDMGFIPVGSSREQFGAFLKAEHGHRPREVLWSDDDSRLGAAVQFRVATGARRP